MNMEFLYYISLNDWSMLKIHFIEIVYISNTNFNQVKKIGYFVIWLYLKDADNIIRKERKNNSST